MLKRLIPENIKKELRTIRTRLEIKRQERREERNLIKLADKNKIKVAFLVINVSIWKYDNLYNLLKTDKRFEPLIFICPFLTYGKELMNFELRETNKLFKEKGYDVINTKQENDSWLDIKNEYNLDVVFISTPWNHTRPEYSFDNFKDKLTCYIPYGFTISTNFKGHYNKNTQNLSWKFFVESEYHKRFAQQYSLRKGQNTVVSGYPGLDSLLDRGYECLKEAWKTQHKRKKRLIWAPHHTIKGVKNAKHYSTFLTYAELMLEIAKKYEDEIQIAFKPHPNLYGKLSVPEIWGEEKTNAYYKKWENLSNGQLEEGEYIDLFLQSDGMIHDSASFLIEYLCVHKPMMFLINNKETFEQFNEYGEKALGTIDLGYTKKDIELFIDETILKGEDSQKDKREQFLSTSVKPKNNKSVSENIYEYLLEEFKIK